MNHRSLSLAPRIIPTSDGLPRTGREPRGKFFPSPSPAEAADDFPRRCFCTPSPVPRRSMLMLNERLRLDHGKEDGRSTISPGLSVRPTAVRAQSRHQLPVSNGVVLRPSNFVPGSFSAWALRLRLRAKETSDGSGRSRPGTGVARLQCGQPRISTPSRQEQLPSAARMTMCASLFAHLVRRGAIVVVSRRPTNPNAQGLPRDCEGGETSAARCALQGVRLRVMQAHSIHRVSDRLVSPLLFACPPCMTSWGL